MVQEYLNQINKKETNPKLVSLRSFAEQNNVPIIRVDGIHFLNHVIQLKNAKKILEIGTAIGYSAICMALHNHCEITTIERDIEMVTLANKHIQEFQLESKIHVVHQDALDVDETLLGSFDLIFIDAAKAQSIKFFDKYKNNLNPKGVIVTDNLLFHELVVAEIKDRNLKQLVGKIDRFNKFVVEQDEFDTYIYNIGDGMSLSIRKD